MPKIATTTLNLSEYRNDINHTVYIRNGFSIIGDKLTTETGLPIFVNKRANGKWGYCDNEGTDFYVKWIEEEEEIFVCKKCDNFEEDSDEEGSTTNESDEDEEEDDEVPPHCQICWNMNSNNFVTKNALNPVCSGKCVAKLIEKHSIKPTICLRTKKERR
jgi:hypothetical protein